MLDNKTSDLSINQCRKYEIKTIHQREINGFTPFTDLFPCYFYQMHIHTYTPRFYYSVIHKMELGLPKRTGVEVKCLMKSN